MPDGSIKLNLGSGDKPLQGYINLDAKFGDTVSPIWRREGDETYGEGVEEIRASHVLEHFPHQTTAAVLAGWVSRLKPAGILKIAVPDFLKIAIIYLEARQGRRDPRHALGTQTFIMGSQADELDYHRAIFDEWRLRSLMVEAGLVDIQRWTSEIDDCAALPISLNLMGRKPHA